MECGLCGAVVENRTRLLMHWRDDHPRAMAYMSELTVELGHMVELARILEEVGAGT